MKKTELLKRIELLEARVAALEARVLQWSPIGPIREWRDPYRDPPLNSTGAPLPEQTVTISSGFVTAQPFFGPSC